MHHYNNIQSIRKIRVVHFYPQVQMTGTDAAEIYIYLFVRRFTMLIVFPTFICIIHRGSYMSAHVLLNLLNELGKIDKMRGLPSILSLFRNEFNKFNNTRARMLDSIYQLNSNSTQNLFILSMSLRQYEELHNTKKQKAVGM